MGIDDDVFRKQQDSLSVLGGIGPYGLMNSAYNQTASPSSMPPHSSECYSFSFRVRVGYITEARRLLEAQKFVGKLIQWLEQRSFFSSEFYVRGPKEDVIAVEALIKARGG